MAASHLTDANASPNLEFVLHVIPPPMKLNWSTPRSLFLATFLNHSRFDKAPIGHLFVEFSLPALARSLVSSKVSTTLQGKQRLITGMSRQKMSMFESLRLVHGKRLGLGTFYYDLKGKLDSMKDAQTEIAWAKARGRHASIRVSVNEDVLGSMMSFMNQWIERGSFLHYSGGLRVDLGEGAGCAEFGMHFLSMALGLRATHPDWMRSVRVPSDLIGGGFAKHSRPVSLWKLLHGGDRWAFQNEDHRVYSIPDPELIFEWIKARDTSLDVTLSSKEISWSGGSFLQPEFDVKYPRESVGSVQEQWGKISEER